MDKKMNKKGYSDLSDILMFLLVSVIIWLGIFSGFYVFYSFQTDVRGEEAKILGNRLVNAVAEDGKIKEVIFEDGFDIFSEAGLDENMFPNGGDFYFNLEANGNGASKVFEKGTLDFRIKCGLNSKGNSPKCFEKEFNLDNYKIKILTASNQLGEKL